MAPLVVQPHLGQRLVGPLPALPLRHPGVHQRDLYIFQQIQLGQEIVLLEDEAKHLVPNLCQLIFVHLAHIPALEEVGALRGYIQAADDIHTCGLARTGGTYDGHEFPLADLKGDVVGGLYRGVPHMVILADVLKGDQCAHIRTLQARRPNRLRARR